VNEFERMAPPAADVQRRAAPATSGPVVARSGDTPAGPLTTDSILRLQRTVGNATVTDMLADGREESPVLDFLAGSSGEPLQGPMRSRMEGSLGADLSGVRVHRGGAASTSAASVQARAYTVGADVVLGNDVNPATAEGQKTLAHELTHVAQQRSGPVDGTPAAGGIRLSDPGDRFEQAAEATAVALTGGGPAAPGPTSAGDGPTAQREAARAPGTDEEQDETSVQGDFVQRQTTATDEEQEEEPGASVA
jgi:hypothetical protein